MYRKIMEYLKEWKESKYRKPLILQGARQVGKTYTVLEFGREYYENVAYFNFETNPSLNKTFDENITPDYLIPILSHIAGVTIVSEKTLIVFDEIQLCERALTSLKYFCENAREYHVISAGSLLGVAIHEGTSFPVGKVDFMDLMPLSFFEFLDALGQKDLLKILKLNDFDMLEVFSAKLKEYLKLYYFIGGMPEAVEAYVTNKDLKEVRKIQKELLDAYEQDFSKHAPSNIVPRIRQLWNNIPTQLAKENKKFIYGLVKEGARAREYEIALSWLIDCGLVYQINRINNCKIPLSAYQDFNAFKLYLLDVGLLAAKAGVDDKTILEGNAIFEEFKGSLTEQYVLCQIKECTDLDVFYWSSDTGIAELDFITQIGRNNVPIEVKASENLQAKSLKSFVQKYNTPVNIRTSMSNYRKEEWLINIPLYSVGNIEKIINNN